MSAEFPVITIGGDNIDARQYIEKRTRGAMFGAFFLAIIGTVLGVLVSYGILLIFLIISPLFAWFINRKAVALIHGSGLKIGADQFPQIHDCVSAFSQRLGIKKTVDVYLIDANVANAAAVRYGKKNIILLTDELIKGCLYSGIPSALSFVIAHELAHIALDHNGIFRSWMSQHMKKLGRLDEYSADRVALALVGDKNAAFYGLLMLTVGYAMMAYVNPARIVAQAQEVAKDKYSIKAEKPLTHPLLLNRLHRVLTVK